MAAVFETGDNSTETRSQVTYEDRIFHKVENFFNCAVDNHNHETNKESDWLSLEGIKPTTQTEQAPHQIHGENFLNYNNVSIIAKPGAENMISNGVCSMKEFPQNSWDKTCKFSKKMNCQIEPEGNSSTESKPLSKLQEENIETEVPSTCKSFDIWGNTIFKAENSTKDIENTKALNVSADADKKSNHFNATSCFKDGLEMECEEVLTETSQSQQLKDGQLSPRINSALEDKLLTPNSTDDYLKTSESSSLNHEHIYSKTDDRTKRTLDTSLPNAHQLAENEENVSKLESKTTKNCLENDLVEGMPESAEKQPNPGRYSNISNLRKHCTPCQVIVQDFFKELNIDLVELSRNFPVKHIQKKSPGRPSLLRQTDGSQNRFFHDGDQEMMGEGANKSNNGVKPKRKPGRKCKKITDKRKQRFSAGTASCENFSDFMEGREDNKEKRFGVVEDDDEEEDNLPLMSVKNNLHQTQMSALLRNNLESSPIRETRTFDNITKSRAIEKKIANSVPSSAAIDSAETRQSESAKRLLTKQAIPGNIEAVSILGNVTVSPYISESTNSTISSATNASLTTNPSVTTAADDDEATIFTTVSLATNNTECNSTNAIADPTNSAVSSSSSASPFSSSFPVKPVTLTTTTENGDGGVQLGEGTRKQSNDGAQPKPNDKVVKFFSAHTTTTVTTLTTTTTTNNNNSNCNNSNRSSCENLNLKTSGQRCVSSTKPKCKYHGLNSAPCRKLYKCKKCGLEAKCLSDIQAHMGGTHSEFCMYRCPYCAPRNRVRTMNSIEFEVLRSSNTNVSSLSPVKKKTPYCTNTNTNNTTNSSSTTTTNTTTTTTNNNNNSSSSGNNSGKKKKVNHQIQLQREKKRKLNYYYRNQHEIKKYKNTKITCEYCRKLVNQSNISRHLNSKSCKGLKKSTTEKQNTNDSERTVIKKYQKVKCDNCQKHISRTNLSKHCRICPKENLHN